MKYEALALVLVLAISVSVHASTNDGLIGWWKLDESIGRIVSDSSGHGNIGRFSGIIGVAIWQRVRADCETSNEV